MSQAGGQYPRRAPLIWAVLGATAVHLALPFCLQPGPLRLAPGGHAFPGPTGPRKPVTVSRILQVPLPASDEQGEPLQSLSAEAPDAQPGSPAVAPPQPMREPEAAEVAEDRPSIISPELAAQRKRAAEAALANLYASPLADEYIDAARLSVRPRIQDVVQIPWPEGIRIPDGVLYLGRFRLFIDERGHVMRIDGEGGTLLGPMIQQAQSIFMRARFVPGQLEGQPVRSWIRIEIEYDARGVVYTRTLE